MLSWEEMNDLLNLGDRVTVQAGAREGEPGTVTGILLDGETQICQVELEDGTQSFPHTELTKDTER